MTGLLSDDVVTGGGLAVGSGAVTLGSANARDLIALGSGGARQIEGTHEALHSTSESDVVYGLMQQFGVSSELDPSLKYDVDVAPPAVQELYRKYGKRLKEYDEWAWDMSQKGLPLRSKSTFPYFTPADKAEYGYVVWERNDGKGILIQELHPDPNDPNYGIKMPDNFNRRTGKFDERPGYKLALVMHTHPWEVTFATPWSRGVVRGPSVVAPGKKGDFDVAYQNPSAVFMIIGAVPLRNNPQQRWYYGQPVHPRR